MNLKAKLIGDEDERAVSPVIGVILMVAITVILAAVIAAFVLDLGQSTGANAQAGVTFEHDSSNEEIVATISSVDRADDIWIQCGSGNTYDKGSSNFDSAGAKALAEYGTLSGSEDIDCTGETLVVLGDYNGNEAVITEFDGHN